jgi:Asparagine synthase (glutamine-hydrolyzing)
MSLFVCAIHSEGDRVPESFRRDIDASAWCADRDLRWHSARGFLGAVAIGGPGAGPGIVRLGPVVGIGVARLDNRRDVARWCSSSDNGESDLALAVRYVTRDLGARVGKLLGDFAFVVWDPTCRTVLAVRDAFGVRKLFHADLTGDLLAFASHASLLAAGDEYDLELLAQRVAQVRPDADRTVYRGVAAVPPASVLRVRGARRATSVYRTAADAQAAGMPTTDAGELCERFRALLIEAVQVRLSDGDSWSHLSGGLDSSSVVSIAQTLALRGSVAQGLAGTLTYTDSLGTSADERAYSDVVVRAYGVRNELVPHRGHAEALLTDPPLLDQPNLPFTMAVRDRAAGRVVRDAGGRVLLTGEGGDSLVAGTMFFFADWMVSGRLRQAVREMAHRSALGRVSFWKLAYENALLPVMPRALRRVLTRAKVGSIPPWIPTSLAARFGLASRSMLDDVYGGPLGLKYAHATAATIAAIPFSTVLGPLDDLVDLRHPYLHRPLVELALGLPPELCVRPHARKWILREAMRGILPEPVRTRVGKGALDGLNVWSLVHDAVRVDGLLRDPILAQLGCVELPVLQRILDDVRSGRASHEGWRDLINTMLDVEMWLQLRAGRWAATEPQRRCSTTVAMAGSAVPSLPDNCPGASS